MTLIQDTDALAEFCEVLAGEPYLAIDTEFMRDRTYWPKLCLVQIAGTEQHAAIDPLAPGINLEPLFELMQAPPVKVFHAARQDVEIFYHLTGQIPSPLFDTQLAAMVLGYGEEVGYETLVAQVAKARVDKSSRFTDWSKRPLSPKQLAYALADVTHLRVVYDRLSRRLDDWGRRGWLTSELAGLTDPETYIQEPATAWRRVKVRSRDPRFLAIVRALAAWREVEAQKRDLPRARVLRDDLLLEVAASRPASPEEVAALRRVSVDKASQRGIAEAVAAALALGETDLPRVAPPPKLPRGLGPRVDLLRVLLKAKCEEHHVAQRLVANTDDLERLVALEAPDVPALHGWRRDVFGDAALALKRGEVSLAIRNEQVELVAMPDGSAGLEA